MALIKVALGLVTFFITGFLQYYVSAIALPSFILSNEKDYAILMVLIIFTTTHILMAAAIVMIVSRFNADNRLAGVLYTVGALPLFILPEWGILLGIGLGIFGIALILSWYAYFQYEVKNIPVE